LNRHDIQTLIEFDHWANHRMLAAARSLSAEAFSRNVGGSFRSLQETLIHTLWAEWIWLQRWQGQSPQYVFSAADFPDVEAVERRWLEVERGQHDFVKQLTDERLSRRVGYENLKGERWEYLLGHMIQHVVNHSTYHRGQVVTLLRQLGAQAPSTDFLLYFDELAVRAT
jgi:uncharacterized damage-inducible protein DinB